MGIISKDNLPDFIAAIPREEVDLTAFGIAGSVYVRALTQAEEREAMKYSMKQDAQLNAYVASVSVVDEDGKALFTLQQVQGFAGRTVRHLAEVCMRLSGMGPEAGNASLGGVGEMETGG